MRDSEWGFKNDTKLASKYKSLEPLYLDALDCLEADWLLERVREEESVRVSCILEWAEPALWLDTA